MCNYSFADVFDYPAKLETVSQQIPQMDSIKCEFKQEKHLKNIQKPIVSGGDFEFKKNAGVIFYTKYPVKSTTDYTNKNYKQVNEIVNAISSKKYFKLEKEFEFYYKKNDNNWTLGLKPKNNSDAKNFVSTITINGEDYIHQITIAQTNGNKTVIWFKK